MSHPNAESEVRKAAASIEKSAKPGPRVVGDGALVIRTKGQEKLEVWDCADCPEMLVMPIGAFTMGSRDDELKRSKDEGPRKRVTIAQALAVGRFEVTRGEYETFIRATGHDFSPPCTTDRGQKNEFVPDPLATFRDPAFEQKDNHPVVCVSFEDAQAYIAWLNTTTPGKGFRLLTESEWEFFARAGASTPYPWGVDVNDGCLDMNGADIAARAHYSGWSTATCDDGAFHTAPVGSYRANKFGLHDMIGNVLEWVQDCYEPSHENLPTDGSAYQGSGAGCAQRVVRGGSWGDTPATLRSADRYRYAPNFRDDSVGFRIARPIV